jgi:hypothetical protein
MVIFVNVPGSTRLRLALGKEMFSALGSNMEAESPVEADWS